MIRPFQMGESRHWVGRTDIYILIAILQPRIDFQDSSRLRIHRQSMLLRVLALLQGGIVLRLVRGRDL